MLKIKVSPVFISTIMKMENLFDISLIDYDLTDSRY